MPQVHWPGEAAAQVDPACELQQYASGVFCVGVVFSVTTGQRCAESGSIVALSSCTLPLGHHGR